MPELGRDEAMPCIFSHYRRSRLGDGVHGPLHRLGVNWIGRNGHRSLHYVPQLAVTQISQEWRLCDWSIPGDHVCITHGLQVYRWDGEDPGLLRWLLSCNGCDGTAVNTGTKGGVCWLFELVSESSVHYVYIVHEL